MTGYTLNDVPFYDGSSSSSSSSITSQATSTATNSASAKKSGGSNTVGIVVGVIVGIVLLAAAGGGGFLFLRRKQQREMEEYKKHNDLQSFVDGGKPENNRPQMWAPDSRLDTADARRISNGSIADNQDYSRKILQVRR
jgi:cell wall integrity and stress response component